jgi:hypothetical protein
MAATALEGRVTTDLRPGGRRANTIPGAERNGSGDDGVADVILWTGSRVYIWEIKARGKGNGQIEFGQQQLTRYVVRLQEKLINSASGPRRRVRRARTGCASTVRLRRRRNASRSRRNKNKKRQRQTASRIAWSPTATLATTVAIAGVPAAAAVR